MASNPIFIIPDFFCNSILGLDAMPLSLKNLLLNCSLLFLFQIEDLQGQIKYLNESMGNMKVDHDLQLEKMKKEIDYDGSSHLAEVDKKDAAINKLNEENDKLKVELELIKDELSAKTEEVEELQTDLEVKEAGFNNRYVNFKIIP